VQQKHSPEPARCALVAKFANHLSYNTYNFVRRMLITACPGASCWGVQINSQLNKQKVVDLYGAMAEAGTSPSARDGDPFASPDFNAAEYFNQRFPDGENLLSNVMTY